LLTYLVQFLAEILVIVEHSFPTEADGIANAAVTHDVSVSHQDHQHAASATARDVSSEFILISAVAAAGQGGSIRPSDHAAAAAAASVNPRQRDRRP